MAMNSAYQTELSRSKIDFSFAASGLSALGHDAELSPGEALEQGIQPRPLVAAPGATPRMQSLRSRPMHNFAIAQD